MTRVDGDDDSTLAVRDAQAPVVPSKQYVVARRLGVPRHLNGNLAEASARGHVRASAECARERGG
jgi:hypothetical protein